MSYSYSSYGPCHGGSQPACNQDAVVVSPTAWWGMSHFTPSYYARWRKHHIQFSEAGFVVVHKCLRTYETCWSCHFASHGQGIHEEHLSVVYWKPFGGYTEIPQGCMGCQEDIVVDFSGETLEIRVGKWS